MATNLFERAKALFPFFTNAQARAFADALADNAGDMQLAMAEFRADPRYDTWFPGNRRDDQTVRHTEFEYATTVEGYSRQIASLGILPDTLLTPERIARLVQSGTSVGEFEEQTNALEAGIVAQGEEVIEGFARLIGVDPGIGRAALFGAAFDEAAPDGMTRTPAQLAREIGAAQVSAEASRFGFGFLDREQALRFQGVGLTQDRSRELFGQARDLLPDLNRLREVFNDPDDPLTLDRFVGAMQTGNPDDLDQIGRLLLRSQAQFSPRGLLGRRQGDEGIAALRG